MLRDHVATKIGPIAKPKTIVFTDDLPKTRSGKIMRRLLRDVAEGRALGDTTTLADASVVEEIARARRDRAHRGVTRTHQLVVARTTRSSRDPRSCSTSTACCPTRSVASTTSRARAATGGRSSTRAATIR